MWTELFLITASAVVGAGTVYAIRHHSAIFRAVIPETVYKYVQTELMDGIKTIQQRGKVEYAWAHDIEDDNDYAKRTEIQRGDEQSVTGFDKEYEVFGHTHPMGTRALPSPVDLSDLFKAKLVKDKLQIIPSKQTHIVLGSDGIFRSYRVKDPAKLIAATEEILPDDMDPKVFHVGSMFFSVLLGEDSDVVINSEAELTQSLATAGIELKRLDQTPRGYKIPVDKRSIK